jgi:hypothetical protein
VSPEAGNRENGENGKGEETVLKKLRGNTVQVEGPAPELTPKKKKFTGMAVFASLLTVGTIAWSTHSILDVLDAGKIGLAFAGLADLGWLSITYAKWRGTRLPVPHREKYTEVYEDGSKVERKVWNPRRSTWPVTLIGWIIAVIVSGLLVLHGVQDENLGTMLAAIFPIITKLIWTVAIADAKDPADLTEDDLEEIAETKREAAKVLALAEAEKAQKQAELEAARIDRQNQREEAEAKAEMERAERRRKHEANLDEAEMSAELEFVTAERTIEHQIRMQDMYGKLDARQAEAERARRYLMPPTYTIPGQIVRTDQQVSGSAPSLGQAPVFPGQQQEPLSPKEELALKYWQEHQATQITKKDFATTIAMVHPARVTEATKDFSPEYFMAKGLLA